MSYLDNLESNLKNMESREERSAPNRRDAKARGAERGRTQASAVYAEQLKKGAYAAGLLRDATRLGHSTRTKVHIAWLGTTLRLEARGRKLELRPTPEGVIAAFFEGGAQVRTAPVDLGGNPETLAREWMGSLPPPAPEPPPDFDFE